MTETPDWLPDLILLEDHGGDWSGYLEAIYAHFRQDFVADPPTNFAGSRFALKRHPLTDGKEATFWHLISEGPNEQERLLNLRRCERIRWPRALIGAPPDKVLQWRNRRTTEERLLIALPDFSYVVVLAVRAGYVLLWTAYPVERAHQREKLRKEYEAYRKQLTPP